MIFYGLQLPVNQIHITLLFRNIGKNFNKLIDPQDYTESSEYNSTCGKGSKIDPVEVSAGNSRKGHISGIGFSSALEQIKFTSFERSSVKTLIYW